jgi:serine O-acetyltransferase
VVSANRTVKMGRLEHRVVRFLYWTRSGSKLGRRLYPLARLCNIEMRPTLTIGPGLRLLHVGSGHRVFRYATLGSNVVLGPNVLIGGKLDLWSEGSSDDTKLIVGDDVIFGAGCVVLCRSETEMTIGAGAVIGANSVVTHSIGPWEIWAGNPAQLVGHRERPVDTVSAGETGLATPAPRRPEPEAKSV